MTHQQRNYIRQAITAAQKRELATWAREEAPESMTLGELRELMRVLERATNEAISSLNLGGTDDAE